MISFPRSQRPLRLAHYLQRKQNSFLKKRFVEASSGTTLKQLSWLSSFLQWRNYLRRSSRHNFETSAGWPCFKHSDIYEALITEEELHGVFAELQNWGDCARDLVKSFFIKWWSNLKWSVLWCVLRSVCICMARPFFLNHAPNDLDATSELSLWLFSVAVRKHQLDTVKGSDCHCWRGKKIHWSQHEGAKNHWTFKSSALAVFSLVPWCRARVQKFFIFSWLFRAWPFHGVWASQESQFILGRLEVSVYPRDPKQPLGQPWGHDESSMTWGDFFLRRLEAMDMTMLSLDSFQNFQHDELTMIDDSWLMIDEIFSCLWCL